MKSIKWKDVLLQVIYAVISFKLILLYTSNNINKEFSVHEFYSSILFALILSLSSKGEEGIFPAKTLLKSLVYFIVFITILVINNTQIEIIAKIIIGQVLVLHLAHYFFVRGSTLDKEDKVALRFIYIVSYIASIGYSDSSGMSVTDTILLILSMLAFCATLIFEVLNRWGLGK